MPLADDSALRKWAETDDPPYGVWRRVEEWIAGLDAVPWQAPSVPLTLATGAPAEIRAVVVPGTDVEVFWEHEHATGVVNILHVGTTGPA
jgi:hypothetical protein